MAHSVILLRRSLVMSIVLFACIIFIFSSAYSNSFAIIVNDIAINLKNRNIVYIKILKRGAIFVPIGVSTKMLEEIATEFCMIDKDYASFIELSELMQVRSEASENKKDDLFWKATFEDGNHHELHTLFLGSWFSNRLTVDAIADGVRGELSKSVVEWLETNGTSARCSRLTPQPIFPAPSLHFSNAPTPSR